MTCPKCKFLREGLLLCEKGKESWPITGALKCDQFECIWEKHCDSGDVLSPVPPNEVLFECEYWERQCSCHSQNQLGWQPQKK